MSLKVALWNGRTVKVLNLVPNTVVNVLMQSISERRFTEAERNRRAYPVLSQLVAAVQAGLLDLTGVLLLLLVRDLGEGDIGDVEDPVSLPHPKCTRERRDGTSD